MILRPVTPAVAHWSADDKAAGRVDKNLHLRVHQFSRQGRDNNVLHHLLADLGVRNFRSVLGADQDGVDTRTGLP
jgi:hypothetical protein